MKKIYLFILGLIVLVSACELPDNIDPKSATAVPAETILANGIRGSLLIIDEMDQNYNISRMLCQYISMAQYTEPSRYIFSERQIPDGFWNSSYLALKDLAEVKMLIADDPLGNTYKSKYANMAAIVDILEVHAYMNLVDFFGDIPYTEALGGFENKTPVYDDAATIYADLQSRLTADIATLSAGSEAGSWDNGDLVYNGDVAMWKKFAATLKLRMGMRLADVDKTTAQAEVTAALAAGVFEPGESMQLNWAGVTPHVNTIYDVFIVENRNDYVPSQTIISKMEELGDARMTSYFTQVDTSSVDSIEKFAYVGLEYGLIGNSNYPKFCHFSDAMFEASAPSTYACNAEVEFILAEGAARGMNVGGGLAQEHYEAGILESHLFWGADTSNLAAYLAHPDVAWDDARSKELIGTQKWIALFSRGNEGYNVTRTFDWPVLHVPEEMTYADIPMRYPYPFNEPDLNGESYTAASAAIGGDDVSTLLFWDVTTSTETPAPGF